MPPSWDELIHPTERTNLKRRLHRVWTSDLSLDEVVDEMAVCLRCRFKPGTMYGCGACRGNPDKMPACQCGGSGWPKPCDLCGGSGVMPGMSLHSVSLMAIAMKLPTERQCESYIPTEAEIRLACAKIRMGWTTTQMEAALRGTMNSAGDNGDAGDHLPEEEPRRRRVDR